MSKKQSITIEFDSAEAAIHFASWICESGEQDYWEWMKYREDEEDGDITVTEFDYNASYLNEDEEEKVNHPFMVDWTIRTKLGRLDDPTR